MKQIQQVIVEQFEDLLKEGEYLINIAKSSGKCLSDVSEIVAWIAKGGQIIKSLCPKESVYFERFSSILQYEHFYNIHSNHYYHLGVIQGCIRAVYDDYKAGLLTDLKSLLRSEIFGDFLEMAEYLLREGYKDPSAVLIGAVLENSLRKLAIKNGISVEKADGSPKTMEPLNQELYKSSIYDKLIQKQITSWADLRNKAAHGQFDSYDQKHVEFMLLFVQKFCSEFMP